MSDGVEGLFGVLGSCGGVVGAKNVVSEEFLEI